MAIKKSNPFSRGDMVCIKDSGEIAKVVGISRSSQDYLIIEKELDYSVELVSFYDVTKIPEQIELSDLNKSFKNGDTLENLIEELKKLRQKYGSDALIKINILYEYLDTILYFKNNIS